MIDYYGQLLPEPHQRLAVGDTVIFGFRAQAFFTRAVIVPDRRRGQRTARGEGSLDKRRPPRLLAGTEDGLTDRGRCEAGEFSGLAR